MAKIECEKELAKLDPFENKVTKAQELMFDKAVDQAAAYKSYKKGAGQIAKLADRLKELHDAAKKVEDRCKEWQDEITKFRDKFWDPVLKKIKSEGKKYKDEVEPYCVTVTEYLTNSESTITSLKNAASMYKTLVKQFWDGGDSVAAQLHLNFGAPI